MNRQELIQRAALAFASEWAPDNASLAVDRAEALVAELQRRRYAQTSGGGLLSPAPSEDATDDASRVHHEPGHGPEKPGANCTHEGIGLPECPTCDPRRLYTAKHLRDRCDQVERETVSAIVAWLREDPVAVRCFRLADGILGSLANVADVVERGDWKKGGG